MGDCEVRLPADAIERVQRDIRWDAPDASRQASALIQQQLVDYVTRYHQRGSVAIQVLDGRVDVRAGEDAIEIGAGEIAVVSPDQPWRAAAMTDGLLLLHLAWPPEPASS